MTPERVKYHEFQERFKKYLKKGCLIYDIGKSDIWDYQKTFKDYDYKTIDKLKEKNPDIVQDMEDTIFLDQTDAFVLNGVTEQCDDPFKLLHNLYIILDKGGIALFGICSVGYPIGEWDYLRFTPKGVEHLLTDYEILEKEIVYRDNFPSYMFVIAKKC